MKLSFVFLIILTLVGCAHQPFIAPDVTELTPDKRAIIKSEIHDGGNAVNIIAVNGKTIKPTKEVHLLPGKHKLKVRSHEPVHGHDVLIQILNNIEMSQKVDVLDVEIEKPGLYLIDLDYTISNFLFIKNVANIDAQVVAAESRKPVSNKITIGEIPYQFDLSSSNNKAFVEIYSRRQMSTTFRDEYFLVIRNEKSEEKVLRVNSVSHSRLTLDEGGLLYFTV